MDPIAPLAVPALAWLDAVGAVVLVLGLPLVALGVAALLLGPAARAQRVANARARRVRGLDGIESLAAIADHPRRRRR